MAPVGKALPQTVADPAVPSPAPSEPPGFASEQRLIAERRAPSARDTLATLTEVEPKTDFEAHDTIPAPPWLGDELAAPSES